MKILLFHTKTVNKRDWHENFSHGARLTRTRRRLICLFLLLCTEWERTQVRFIYWVVRREKSILRCLAQSEKAFVHVDVLFGRRFKELDLIFCSQCRTVFNANSLNNSK